MESKTYPFSKKKILLLFSVFSPVILVVVLRALTLPPISWRIWIWIVVCLVLIYAMLCLFLFISVIWKPLTFGGVEPTLAYTGGEGYHAIGYRGFVMKAKYIQEMELKPHSGKNFLRSDHLMLKSDDPMDPQASKQGIVDLQYYADDTIVQIVTDLKNANPSIKIGPLLAELLQSKGTSTDR